MPGRCWGRSCCGCGCGWGRRRCCCLADAGARSTGAVSSNSDRTRGPMGARGGACVPIGTTAGGHAVPRSEG
eukprot:2805985-Alexandrium_andersonii.AAC.1